MEFCTLASSSKGNAALVCAGNTRLLLDAGLSARRTYNALHGLGVEPSSLTGILITHSHRDHMAGLEVLTKQLGLPIYATAACARQLCYRIPFLDDHIRPVTPGVELGAGELCLRAFSTPHDAPGSVGYALTTDRGCSLALCTDLGHLTDEVLSAVAGADLVVAELNHDEDWVTSGPYPYFLKKRILGPEGHLSNEAGAALARHAVEQGARTVVLGHLSQENNTPARALETACRVLRAGGIDPERDIHLSVAPRDCCGPLFRLASGERAAALSTGRAALC